MANDLEPFFSKMAKKHLEGKRVKDVRYMTKAEQQAMCWESRGIVLVFEDNTKIYPSMDSEGNNAGALCGFGKGTEQFIIPIL